MKAPAQPAYELGRTRGAIGFPWTIHRTLKEIAQRVPYNEKIIAEERDGGDAA